MTLFAMSKCRQMCIVVLFWMLGPTCGLADSFLDERPLTFVMVGGESLNSEVGRTFDMVVGPGPEVDASFSIAEVDVSDSQIAYRFRNPGAFRALEFNGPKFTDSLDAVDPFGDVYIDEDNTTLLLDEDSVYFDENTVFLNLSGILFNSDDQVTLSVNPVIAGDINGNRRLDADDIDQLTDSIERDKWVHQLANTYFGDANLDGEFTSDDLISVFTAGEYEDAIAQNSGWESGDWDGDGEFTSSDIVLAFQDGGYDRGPRGAADAVPEPTSFAALCVSLIGIATVSTSRRGRTVLGRADFLARPRS